VKRLSASSFSDFISDWRASARAATAIFGTTDGRWALVSTSATALIAGSIAWLAAGTIPPATSHGFEIARDRSLLPYELFLRLASHGDQGGASYASFGPAGSANTQSPSRTDAQNALDNSLAAERAGGDDTPQSDTHTMTMDSGDTLVGALQDAGVSDDDANAAVLALQKIYNTRSLRAGQSFELTFAPSEPVSGGGAQITYSPPSQAAGARDEEDSGDGSVQPVAPTPAGKLLSISFSPTVDHELTIARTTDGSFAANDQVKTLTAHYHRAGATIDSSLYLAAMQAGIPADVVVEMIHMLSYQVDFQRDIRPGDSFQVLYSYYYTPDGQPAKQGDIAYAQMKLAGRDIVLYRYQPNGNEPADYLDSKGQSAKSLLMKTPVDGARITSGFGMRFHPVLGYTRMHKGIDFGVPVGTPVMAAGSGVIKTEGRAGGYGNLLLINHENGYATAYGHLSRFAPGLHVGSHVHQGQIVAFSGNTGMSTGPHLHYEIRINNVQVNPLKVKFATGRRLAGNELRNFLGQRLHIDSELAAMPLESKVPDSTGDLRAAKD